MKNYDKVPALKRGLLTEMLGTLLTHTGENIGVWIDRCVDRVEEEYLFGNEKLRARIVHSDTWLVIGLFYCTNDEALAVEELPRRGSISIGGIVGPIVSEKFEVHLREASRREFHATV